MKNNPAVIITNKTIKQTTNIILEALQKYQKNNRVRISNKQLPYFFTIGHSYEGGLNVLVIKDIFINYRDYDGFLIYLVQNYGFWSSEKNGLLLGHFDNTGFLWTDYQHFIKYKPEAKQ